MEGTTMLFKALLLLILVNTSLCTDKFVLVGGSIKLPLPEAQPVGTKITSVIWKHNRDKAAEYFAGDDSPTCFDKFKNVANLDMNTWALTISNLQSEFNGPYSAEVNNKDLAQFVTLHVLPAVSKPNISMECNEDNCTLTCEGTENGGFTKYTWSDDKESKGTGPVLTVLRKDQDVTYTCNFSNPVSSQTSSRTVPKKKNGSHSTCSWTFFRISCTCWWSWICFK